jgi:hypothetical protein
MRSLAEEEEIVGPGTYGSNALGGMTATAGASGSNTWVYPAFSTTKPNPYCQNCDCGGCKIHRERDRIVRERESEWERTQQRMSQGIGKSYDIDDVINARPGDVIPVYNERDDRKKIVRSRIPWRWIWFGLCFLAGCQLWFKLFSREV